jgi:hypothetical protein
LLVLCSGWSDDLTRVSLGQGQRGSPLGQYSRARTEETGYMAGRLGSYGEKKQISKHLSLMRARLFDAERLIDIERREG